MSLRRFFIVECKFESSFCLYNVNSFTTLPSTKVTVDDYLLQSAQLCFAFSQPRKLQLVDEKHLLRLSAMTDLSRITRITLNLQKRKMFGMYVCMHACMYVCMYVCIVYMYLDVPAYTYIYAWAYVCTCKSVCNTTDVCTLYNLCMY